ncbi:energy-coupling factor transporter transmembrane component T family protein [Pengzhenrongella frigida]|uniref:Energy-coupling factor transporter transmembrane protein EcfT n=1 Tax=Pengzhenrongella frigida TaxID=1259133 RepID=A0A4Q5N1X6_9MICO|nr:energy-coupling factor transporter transmembrane component T [Cellulomonas sp. HLT2-17]RYV50547.1 energy-coupling factor transporter transmembrane protein EcfT [Cellulomonas sp. HLT2-17]
MSRRRRSPWIGPLGLYSPGSTPLHRAPVGAKLTALALLGLAVVLVRGPVGALALLAVAAAAAAVARQPARATLTGLVPVLATAAGLAAFQWWQQGLAAAIEVSVDLLTLVVAAGVVTATTPADRMLDALERAARPLRHVGLRPESFALSVALMLRTVPALVQTAAEVRDAARARGLERNPRALLVPAAVRTVARARTTGAALAARGLGE